MSTMMAALPNEERQQHHDEVLVIGAVQCPLRNDHQDPLDACHQVIKLMKQQTSHQPKVQLFVLPELAPLGYSEDTFARYLPNTKENLQLYKTIHQNMVHAAQELHAYICYGTVGMLSDHTSYTIRQTVVDTQGMTVATHDKMLLCDYGDCAETGYFTAGTELESFTIQGFTVGILLCADIRNPLHARRLVSTHHADVVIQPAAFSRDFSFYTWKSFQTTRAVENSVYWVGVNYSGDYHGESCLTPPWVDDHHQPIIMNCQTGVLVGSVKRSTLNHVRTSMPYYKLLIKEGKLI